MKSASVSVVICSPPYWPVKRWYGGGGVGFERTLGEYIANLTAVFCQARRVVKDDGVLWIVIGDSYSTGGGQWKPDGYKPIGQRKNDLCRLVRHTQARIVRRAICS